MLIFFFNSLGHFLQTGSCTNTCDDWGGGEQKKSFHSLPPLCPVANSKPSLEMENEEKIRLEARRRLEEQLKQYRVQRHKERVSPLPLLDSAKIKNQLKQRACAFLYQ